MKKVLLLSAITLFLSSCFSVSFQEPQPVDIDNLSAFPDKILGNYLTGNDTIIVTHTSYTTEDGTYFISDSVVVRKFKKYYVLSVLEDRRWTVLLLKPQVNGDLIVYSINDDDHEDGSKCDQDSLIAEMREICVVKRRDREYFANPSKKEFKKLIKKDIFRPMGELNRIAGSKIRG